MTTAAGRAGRAPYLPSWRTQAVSSAAEVRARRAADEAEVAAWEGRQARRSAVDRGTPHTLAAGPITSLAGVHARLYVEHFGVEPHEALHPAVGAAILRAAAEFKVSARAILDRDLSPLVHQARYAAIRYATGAVARKGTPWLGRQFIRCHATILRAQGRRGTKAREYRPQPGSLVERCYHLALSGKTDAEIAAETKNEPYRIWDCLGPARRHGLLPDAPKPRRLVRVAAEEARPVPAPPEPISVPVADVALKLARLFGLSHQEASFLDALLTHTYVTHAAGLRALESPARYGRILINQIAHTLRCKLGEHAAGIRNIRGVGYTLDVNARAVLVSLLLGDQAGPSAREAA